MEAHVRDLVVLPVLMVGLGLVLSGRTAAQTFTTLHSFGGGDGAIPFAGLILSGNTLYGTTMRGGSSGYGAVFRVNTDGTGFTNLHSFPPFAIDSPNSDGAYPTGGLILSGNTLYGTAFEGGSFGGGTVFALNTDGTGFTNLHSLGNDAAYPCAGLVLSGNTLYGTTLSGNSYGNGTVFTIGTNGTGFVRLHSFDVLGGVTNSSYAGLILSAATLYGTAFGGSQDVGSVFKLNTDGMGFTNLYSFDGGSDGAHPAGGLILSANTLYGTTTAGGGSGNGTVFKINADGTGFTNLYSFTAGASCGYSVCNRDGAMPRAGLILSGNTLYGTAVEGGSSGNGTVFAVNTDGTGFTNLYSFTGGSDGAYPWAALVLCGNTLYGTASSGYGTVFSLSLPLPRLTIIPSGANVILAWPTNATGFTLQSTTNLVSPAIWATNSTAPAVVNGQNTVTNPITGTRQFYRLSQ
ncbi:MAG TPA: choice-of-anchor tandem repeat GloVer-containing protein [Candidatus Binatia bacterium]|jgi:uncharacterized repeat protein (TIGR03803 family)|nr:choice-of-anchor tandem repeat GloVer-containing protein [Candidatus Binatia bacterium]